MEMNRTMTENVRINLDDITMDRVLDYLTGRAGKPRHTLGVDREQLKQALLRYGYSYAEAAYQPPVIDHPDAR
jgi:hypothetical protein